MSAIVMHPEELDRHAARTRIAEAARARWGAREDRRNPAPDPDAGVGEGSNCTDLVAAKVDRARLLLASARNASDAKKVTDMAHAAEIFARRQKLSKEAIDHAHSIMVEAMTLMGEFLKAAPKAKPPPLPITSGPGRGNKRSLPKAEATVLKRKQVLKTVDGAETEITHKASSDAQHLADLKEKNPARYEKLLKNEIPLSKMRLTHVNNNSGEDEWYTPQHIIHAARHAMGGIDLDPASSEAANRLVQAREFFTKEQDGLGRKWSGNVWLNPPYSQPGIKLFAEKVCWAVLEANDRRFTSPDEIEQLCMIVNNATDTEWLQSILRLPRCSICLLKGRVRFLNRNGEVENSPLQGQIVLYFGNRPKQFAHAFAELGQVFSRQ